MSKVTNAELKLQLDTFIARIDNTIKGNHEQLCEKIDGVDAKLTDFEERIAKLEEKSHTNENSIGELDANVTINNIRTAQKFDELLKRIEDLEEKLKALDDVPKDIKQLSEDIESRTNRQLRETLVFKNIPETPGVDKESYKDTKDLLATTISETCDGITKEFALSQIKRAHRESGHRRDNKEHPRTGKKIIYAAFHSWDLCQTIIEQFREKCIADQDFEISADQKYGPKTNRRRQLAFKLRKQLKQDGAITSGFVDFPAKLMVNYPGEVIGRKKVYRLHTNFSNQDVDAYQVD